MISNWAFDSTPLPIGQRSCVVTHRYHVVIRNRDASELRKLFDEIDRVASNAVLAKLVELGEVEIPTRDDMEFEEKIIAALGPRPAFKRSEP